MPALCRRLNYRNIELYSTTRGEAVEVRLASGATKLVPWLGFVDREDAKAVPDGKPVKIIAARYSNSNGMATDWVDMGPDEYVRGCLTKIGVYAVTVTGARIVTRRG